MWTFYGEGGREGSTSHLSMDVAIFNITIFYSTVTLINLTISIFNFYVIIYNTLHKILL